MLSNRKMGALELFLKFLPSEKGICQIYKIATRNYISFFEQLLWANSFPDVCSFPIHSSPGRDKRFSFNPQET